MQSQDITQAALHELLSYNAETGVFIWKVSKGRIRAGSVAGGKSLEYLAIGINKKVYYAHRLAWLYVYGSLPELQIDHINGDRSDNRISNLRHVTHSENGKNQKVVGGKSGLPGVYLRESGRYLAKIKHNKKEIRLGLFDSPEEAHDAYLTAKRKLQPVGYHRTILQI